MLGFNLRTCSLWNERICSNFTVSHSVVCGRKRSDTLVDRRFSGTGPIGLHCSVWKSQGSSQMLIEVPVPIIQYNGLVRRHLPIKTLCQPCEEFLVALTERNFSEWQYFPRRVLANRQEGFLMIRQPIFARRASFVKVISLNPSLPFFLWFSHLLPRYP